MKYYNKELLDFTQTKKNKFYQGFGITEINSTYSLNHKKNILTYNFSDKKLVGSKHIFKIVVSDNVGNTNTLSATFFKKQVN